MKVLIKIYHFLGSITLAISLISLTALLVIIGTFLESSAESHRYAARYVYHHPLFLLLLWLFFVNILVSALRRWPFKISHIPFLITHFGLLMILGGALVKSYSGTQGIMGIAEGSSNQAIFLDNTYVIQVQKRDEYSSEEILEQFPLLSSGGRFQKNLVPSSSKKLFPELEISLIDYHPHALEYLETWIRKDQVQFFSQAPPITVVNYPIIDDTHLLEVGGQHPIDGKMWNLMAFRTDEVQKLVTKAYIHDSQLILTDRQTGKIVIKVSLAEVLDHQITFEGGNISGKLDFSFSLFDGFQLPELELNISANTLENATIKIPLQGPESLLNLLPDVPFLGSFPLAVDLERTPTLLAVQDSNRTTFIFNFAQNGSVQSKSFSGTNLTEFFVYDNGYGGYTTTYEVSQISTRWTRQEKELANLHHLSKELRNSLENHRILSPPLQLIYDACEKTKKDFASTFVEFLYQWDHSFSWLYPTNLPLEENISEMISLIDWEGLPASILRGCQLNCEVFDDVDQQLQQGKKVKSLLGIRDDMGNSDDEKLLTALTQHIFEHAEKNSSTAPILPSEASAKARWLSAYLRAYQIHWQSLILPGDKEEMEQRWKSYELTHHNSSHFADTLTMESSITPIHMPLPLEKKYEKNTPKVTLQLSYQGRTEILTLGYDTYGTGLKWPTSDGHYLLRFQPQFQELPYRVRLQDARQINYPNSLQSFSFESDLVIEDMRNHQKNSATISMNNVFETWDGYRFYLANISPAEETRIQKAQIIVNHDPAKYYLTYPGSIILSLGILLLFWKSSSSYSLKESKLST